MESDGWRAHEAEIYQVLGAMQFRDHADRDRLLDLEHRVGSHGVLLMVLLAAVVSLTWVLASRGLLKDVASG